MLSIGTPVLVWGSEATGCVIIADKTSGQLCPFEPSSPVLRRCGAVVFDDRIGVLA